MVILQKARTSGGVLDVRIRDSFGGSLAGYGITTLVRQNFERHNRRTLRRVLKQAIQQGRSERRSGGVPVSPTQPRAVGTALFPGRVR